MDKILIINNGEAEITEFTKPLASIVEYSGLKAITTEYKDSFNCDLYDYIGIIMSGSPQGDDIVEHHLPYFEWVKDCKKPIFGICAGHHITGYLFGSELLRSQEPESGDFNVRILKSDPIFNGLHNEFKVKQMHNDSITVPPDFELIATSDTCVNQLMKHKKKPLYTSQFHPEYYNSEILENFLVICKNQKEY